MYPLYAWLKFIRNAATPGLAASALMSCWPSGMAACLTWDQVYELGGGNVPSELVWQGVHYSSACACTGVTSGLSDGAYACRLGETCRCGTFNGKPWMGKVVHQPEAPVPDFGSAPKPFVRTNHFFTFPIELKILQSKISCPATQHETQWEYVCGVSPDTTITLATSGGNGVRSVTFYWKGNLPESLLADIVDLYGGNDREVLRKELGRTTPQEGHRYYRGKLGNRRWIEHKFFRPEFESPAEHWVTVR